MNSSRLLRRLKAPPDNANKPFCDICWLRDDECRLSRLITCSHCGVVVHPECYHNIKGGEADESRTFVCWPCQAVGTTVKFRERDHLDRRIQTVVKSRPVACCLCNAPDAAHPHALHPLFDDYGNRARQIMLADREPAWVHTLCALFLNHASGGLVYGCTKTGAYGETEDPDRLRRDTDSVNSALVDDGGSDDDDDEEEDLRTHHYAYTLEKWYGPNQGHVKYRRQRRNSTCRGCKKNGFGKHNYSIAIQCMMGEDRVYKKLSQDANGNLVSFEADCTEPWHPGCARYLKNSDGEYPGCQTAFFYPGRGHSAPICNLFCPMHALDIYEHHAAQKNGRVFRARFPEGARIAPVDAANAPRDFAIESEDEDFHASQEEEDYDYDLTLDGDDNSSGSHDDDDDEDRLPRAKKTHPHPKARPEPERRHKRPRSEDETDKKPAAKKSKFTDSKSPYVVGRKPNANAAGLNGHKTTEEQPKAQLSKTVQNDVQIDRKNDKSARVAAHECQGYTYESFTPKPEMAWLLKGCFAKVASNAVARMAKSLSRGFAWPFSSDFVGALDHDKEYWCKLKRRPHDAGNTDLCTLLSLHSVECTGTTELEGPLCQPCRDIRKQVKAVLKKASTSMKLKSQE